jgi:nitrite reductase/ring-hydroxylating ferredoxin subunit
MPADRSTPLARLSDIPTGRGVTVRVGDREIGLFRSGQMVYALEARCPHRQGPLGEGSVEGGRVFCPLHGWEFDLATGACLTNPAKPVACVSVTVADGLVFLAEP